MKKAIIAIFMIMLVVGMPVIFAAETSIISYSVMGSDKAAGTVRENDALDIEALVSISGDNSITPDQVWLGFETPFKQCTKVGENWKCTLRYPETGTNIFKNGFSYSINLHSDSHAANPTTSSILDAESGTLVIDRSSPRIVLGGKTFRGSQKVTISFYAYDDGYSAGDYTSCSGIKSIAFSSTLVKKDFSYAPNRCQVQESFDVDVSAMPEQNQQVTVTVTDYIGKTASDTITVIPDKQGVTFSNIKLVSADGAEVKYIGRNPLRAILVAEVSEDAVFASVKADLRAINKNGNYGSLPGNCAVKEGKSECRWDVTISEKGSLEITLSASDTSNHDTSQKQSLIIGSDLDGPVATSISTLALSDGKSYIIPKSNTIEVTFEETGSGLSKDDVYLDLSNLKKEKARKADECIIGKCIWKNLDFDVSDGTYIVSVNPITKDRLGNILKGSKSANLIMDRSEPRVIEVSVKKAAGAGYEGFITIGNSIEVTAKLYEPGTLGKAYGDFSAIIRGSEKVEADQCRKLENNLWECKWITSAVDMPGYIKDTIGLSFEDFQGNKVTKDVNVEIYEVSSTLENRWTHSVICSPSSIDREVSSLVEQRIFCHVNLAGSAEVVSLSLVGCTADENSAKYLRKSELVNNQAGSKDPYIKLTLHATDIAAERLTATCDIGIISKVGNRIISVPEIEKVSIDVPFYNSPLGSYGQNVQQKANDAVESANGGLWKIISSINKIFFFAERLCSLVTTINKAISLITTIAHIKRTIADVTRPYGEGLEQAGKAEMKISSVLNNKLKKAWIGGEGGKTSFINKFCKFISCQLFYDDAKWGGSVTQALGSWQRTVLNYANLVATGGPVGEAIGLGGQGVNAYTYKEGAVEEHGGVSPKVLLQGGKLNPKDSIVLSFATLCIPGIVYNLNKYRQIQCVYADCLKTSIETGVPLSVCENVKEQATCKYVYGEIFQLMPFAGLLNYLSSLIKSVLSSPYGIVNLAMGYVCNAPINTPYGSSVAKLCLFNEMAGMMADVWSDIANIKDDWKIKDDYCAQI